MGRVGRRLSPLIFLLAACHETSVKTPSPAGSGLVRPDLFLEGLRIQSYEPTGLKWDLTAIFGDMFSEGRLLKAKKMNIQFYEDGKKSADMYADQGIMRTPGDEPKDKDGETKLDQIVLQAGDMFLSGNVVVVSTQGHTLTTDWLHYHKKEELITSTAPVQIVREDSITNGVGLEATSDFSMVRIFNQTIVIKDTTSVTNP